MAPSKRWGSLERARRQEWQGTGIRWLGRCSLLLAALILAGVPAAAQRVLSYSPPESTVGFQAESPLPIRVGVEGITVSPNLSPRAFWRSTGSDGAAMEITGISADGRFVDVLLQPTLRRSPAVEPIIVCQRLPGANFDQCTNPATSERFRLNDAPRISNPSPLPVAGVGVSYAVELQVEGGTGAVRFSTNPDSLPPGLVLNTQTGLLNGLPSVQGDYSFPVTVTDSLGISGTRALVLTVSRLDSSPSIVAPTNLPVATVGTRFAQNFQATGGVPPYQFGISEGRLPQGMTLNSAGTLDGVPTEAGTFPFTVRVIDSREATAERRYTLVVEAGLRILTTSLPAGSTGVLYPPTPIRAEGGLAPYSFFVGQQSVFPPGLFLNPTTGVITGTPTLAGVFTFSIVVRDATSRQIARTYQVEIGAGLRLLTTSPLTPGTVGVGYQARLEAAGGVAPYQFVLVESTAPPGLTLSETGVLAGTPSAPFDGTFRVQVTDSGTPAQTATRTFAIAVRNPLRVLTSSLADARIGQFYSQALSVEGGAPPYAFSVSAGTLPPGLTLVGGGTISGVPTQAGSFPLTLLVRDQDGRVAEAALPVVVRGQTVSGLAVTVEAPASVPNAQPVAQVALDRPAEAPLTGTLTLNFVPSTTPPVDDPAVRFVSGGRTIPFQISQGAREAVFSGAQQAAFQSGTVAGEIRLTATISQNGVDVTPTPAPGGSLVVPALPPTLSSLNVTRTSSGLQIVIRGYSTPRNMQSAILNFAARGGSNVTTPLSFTVDVAAAFASWYAQAGSAAFGSQFQLTIPVTISGEASAIESVSVRLRNSAGESNSLSSSF